MPELTTPTGVPASPGRREVTVAGPTPEQRLIPVRPLSGKDLAVIQSTVSTAELRQQIATPRAGSDVLKARLDSAGDRPPVPAQAALKSELSKANARFSHARKAMEREHDRLRSELTGLRAESQQQQQQLENERKSRREDASWAAARIAALEQQLAIANREKSAFGLAQSRQRAVLFRIAAVLAALGIVAAIVAWFQISARPVPDAGAPRPAPVPTPPPHEFQGALRGLNDALANFPKRRPEDVLAEVRRRLRDTDPSVCAFDWNAGQPALLYAGRTNSVSLATTLSKCAQAVQQARPH